MIINTEEVMAGAVKRMDDAYAALRAVVADNAVLNQTCREITNGTATLLEEIAAVIETRNAFHEMKKFGFDFGSNTPATKKEAWLRRDRLEHAIAKVEDNAADTIAIAISRTKPDSPDEWVRVEWTPSP